MFNMFMGLPDPVSKEYFDKIIEKSQGPKPYFVYDGRTIVSVDVDNMPTEVYDAYATALDISDSNLMSSFGNKLVSINMPNLSSWDEHSNEFLNNLVNISSVELDNLQFINQDYNNYNSSTCRYLIKCLNLKKLSLGKLTFMPSLGGSQFFNDPIEYINLSSLSDFNSLDTSFSNKKSFLTSVNFSSLQNMYLNCINDISAKWNDTGFKYYGIIDYPKISSISLDNAISVFGGSFTGCKFLNKIYLPKCKHIINNVWMEGDSSKVLPFKGISNNSSIFLNSMLSSVIKTNWDNWGIPHDCTVYCQEGVITYGEGSGSSTIDIPAVKSDGTYATYSDVMTLYGNNNLAGILALFPSEGTIGYGNNMYNVQTAVGTALQGSSVDENITVGAYYSTDKSHVFARFTVNSDNAKVNATTYQVVATGLNAGLYDSYYGISDIKSDDNIIFYVEGSYFTMYDSTATSLF